MSAAKNEDGETAVVEAIAAMPEHDRAISERLHIIIKENAPSLVSRTWYGMPAYTDGNKIICWFRSGKKFGERYMTLGFNDISKLDEGGMWPISFAISELTGAVEDEIAALVKKAVS
jgi:hypothetical protein